jgi:hypothetical protein
MGPHDGPQGCSGLAFTQPAFDAVEVPDLVQEPRGNAGVLLLRFEKLPAHMGPAGGELDALLVAGKAGIGSVAVALDGAAKIDRDDLFQARRRAAGFPMEDDVAAGTRGRPQAPHFRGAVARLQVRDGRLIDLHVTAPHDAGADGLRQIGFSQSAASPVQRARFCLGNQTRWRLQ